MIADGANGLSLAVVVETERGAAAARARLDRGGLGAVPVMTVPDASDDDPQVLAERLHAMVPAVAGAIVSTPAIARGAYLRWLLDRGIPVLAEKPPLIRAGASVSVTAAAALLDEFEALLHHPASALISIATQRRYNPIYHRVADHCRAIRRAEGQPITFVQASTNDGLWSDDAYHPIHDPGVTGGGKLINTGYHLLDIVPWIMRHASADAPPASADIACHATRLPGDGSSAHNEVDVALQIAFRDEAERPLCHFQLAALHGGLSRRRRVVGPGPARAWSDMVEGRTKQETLTIFQGPHAAVWMRRIAKLGVTTPAGLGSDDHVEVILARNPSLAGEAPAIEVIAPGYDDGDSAPTIEFARHLRGEDAVRRSPARDHRLAMSLLSGAYRGMASGAPVRVAFHPEDWSTPPGR